MQNNPNFDQLSVKANIPGAIIEAKNELFGNVFLLTEWLFINRSSPGTPTPYIASRADVCEGKPMIRAFTDSNKLIEFVTENNLSSLDQETLILSVPTENIIPWLTGFIASGVHGVWFNSNLSSDGFYVPLVQLMPIKNYLDKNWKLV